MNHIDVFRQASRISIALLIINEGWQTSNAQIVPDDYYCKRHESDKVLLSHPNPTRCLEMQHSDVLLRKAFTSAHVFNRPSS